MREREREQSARESQEKKEGARGAAAHSSFGGEMSLCGMGTIVLPAVPRLSCMR